MRLLLHVCHPASAEFSSVRRHYHTQLRQSTVPVQGVTMESTCRTHPGPQHQHHVYVATHTATSAHLHRRQRTSSHRLQAPAATCVACCYTSFHTTDHHCHPDYVYRTIIKLRSSHKPNTHTPTPVHRGGEWSSVYQGWRHVTTARCKPAPNDSEPHSGKQHGRVTPGRAGFGDGWVLHNGVRRIGLRLQGG